jgi:hypothetical protein
MLLFMAYPGVSLKIMALFKCRDIEGKQWLAIDMRLRCYDSRWAGYAAYGLVMGVVYVVGLPVVVLFMLWRRRGTLFGPSTSIAVAATRARYGFLYEVYGPTAWWWEVEELVRKLLLSAAVVLFEDGSPLQVTLAVLVSGWAHVLHAMYKPWGVGTTLYGLQHGSLFVTSFVFLMGLLFKVQGVSSTSRTYSALSGVMLCLCCGFVVAWALITARSMLALWRNRERPDAIATKGGSGSGGGNGTGSNVGQGKRSEQLKYFRKERAASPSHPGSWRNVGARSVVRAPPPAVERKSTGGRGALPQPGDADSATVMVLHANPLFLTRSRVAHAPKLVQSDSRAPSPQSPSRAAGSSPQLFENDASV